MAKRILERTALEVSRLRAEGVHAVGGAPGLYLQIIGGSRAWVLRHVHLRRRRRMGLGSFPAVGLAVTRGQPAVVLAVLDGLAQPVCAVDVRFEIGHVDGRLHPQRGLADGLRDIQRGRSALDAVQFGARCGQGSVLGAVAVAQRLQVPLRPAMAPFLCGAWVVPVGARLRGSCTL